MNALKDKLNFSSRNTSLYRKTKFKKSWKGPKKCCKIPRKIGKHRKICILTNRMNSLWQYKNKHLPGSKKRKNVKSLKDKEIYKTRRYRFLKMKLNNSILDLKKRLARAMLTPFDLNAHRLEKNQHKHSNLGKKLSALLEVRRRRESKASVQACVI